MSPERTPGTFSLVLVPALITLVVNVSRLVLELAGFGPPLVSAQAGGGGALLGITWLVPIFGVWFGYRLAKTGRGPSSRGRAALLSFAGVAIFLGGSLLCATVLGLVSMGTPEEPKAPEGMEYILGLGAIGILAQVIAWPRAAAVLTLYALCARLPVVAITWIAVRAGWETHFTALMPGIPPLTGDELFFALSTAQVTIWPIFTITVGGLAAAIGAAFGGRAR
jgi:hypothetical protein